MSKVLSLRLRTLHVFNLDSYVLFSSIRGSPHIRFQEFRQTKICKIEFCYFNIL
jgi:hypothetical protein